MILVDASVWIDHFRKPVPKLIELADEELILTHPFIIGELALGSIKDRSAFLKGMDLIAKSIQATDDEVMSLIDRYRLFGRGIGFADAHLLASTLLTDGTKLWSFDRKLHAAAQEINCAADLPGRTLN